MLGREDMWVAAAAAAAAFFLFRHSVVLLIVMLGATGWEIFEVTISDSEELAGDAIGVVSKPGKGVDIQQPLI